MSISDLRKAIANVDEKANEITKELIDKGLNPIDIIEEGIVKGLYDLGEKFEKKKVFIPDLIRASKIAKNCISIVEKVLPKEKRKFQKKIVIGTLLSQHNIGKNLVSTFLSINGFDVYDIGELKEPWDFYEKAEEFNADMIAVSICFVPALQKFVELINTLKEMGVRQKYKVIVGGPITSRKWAEEAGADGWGANASEAVKIAKELLGV